MFTIAIMALRYIFLLFLLVFIFRLVKWMVGDLQLTRLDSFDRFRQDGQLEKEDQPIKGGALLTVKEGATPELSPGDSLALGGEELLGRGEGSDIILRDSFASTRHALVYFKEGQYWLEDLQSTNGTYLNGIPIDQPIVLADGDIIKIGGIIFQFVRWGHEVGSVN